MYMHKHVYRHASNMLTDMHIGIPANSVFTLVVGSCCAVYCCGAVLALVLLIHNRSKLRRSCEHAQNEVAELQALGRPGIEDEPVVDLNATRLVTKLGQDSKHLQSPTTLNKSQCHTEFCRCHLLGLKFAAQHCFRMHVFPLFLKALEACMHVCN